MRGARQDRGGNRLRGLNVRKKALEACCMFRSHVNSTARSLQYCPIAYAVCPVLFCTALTLFTCRFLSGPLSDRGIAPASLQGEFSVNHDGQAHGMRAKRCLRAGSSQVLQNNDGGARHVFQLASKG
eukprot:2231533-Rhodomonas_salina.1